MLSRKTLGAVAITASLVGGGVVGALFGTPITSLAQETTADPTTTVQADAEGDRVRDHDRPFHRRDPGHHRPGRHFKGAALETAAETIGISEDELREALRDGGSIAEVAEANGVDAQAVIDALVAQANERIAEFQETLPDRMTDLVNRDFGER